VPAREWLYSTAKGQGAFREIGSGQWRETTPDKKLFNFIQVSQKPGSVELLDSTRRIWVRLYATYAEWRREPATTWGLLYEGHWPLWSDIPADSDPVYQIRLAYFVPSDRNPTPNFEAKIGVVMQFVSDLYRQNLQGRGFRAKDLAFQNQAGKPIVHLIRGRHPAAYYSGAPNYTDEDRQREYRTVVDQIPPAVGSPNKNVIVVFAETYDFAPAPMEWLGAVALGRRFSTTGGVALVSAWILQDMFCATSVEQERKRLFDETPIPGRVAMGNGRPNSPRSQFVADGIGSVAHELGHALGLSHDLRRLDIMSNGFRRMRANFIYPLQLANGANFSDEAVRFLLTSRYLGADLDFRDNIPPKTTMRIVKARLDTHPASVTVLLQAADDHGLRAVVFYSRNQDSVIGGRALNGMAGTFTQDLEITRPTSGAVQIEAHVTDVGGNPSVASAKL
jgi:hypothetical protein